jgi:integrase
MAGKQAKTLAESDLADLLVYASSTRNPARNRVIVLLSAKAGLRAGEIANLTWAMVLEPSGKISTLLELPDHAAKKRSGRLIPLHADLRDALLSWRSMTVGTGPVVLSERGRAMTPLSVVIWFARAYRAIGLEDARPIPGAARSSPVRHDWFTRPADRCAMSSFSLAINPFKRHSGTSMATATCSASSCP